MIRSIIRASMTAFLIFTLAACGGAGPTPTPTPSPTPTPTPTPTPGGSGISGVVTSPLGTAAGTVVLACYSEACDGNSDGQSSGVNVTDPSGAYSVAVAAGSYAVLAVQDANGDGEFGTGDYLGTYPSAVTAPASGINITLEAVTDTSTQSSDFDLEAVRTAVKRAAR